MSSASVMKATASRLSVPFAALIGLVDHGGGGRGGEPRQYEAACADEAQRSCGEPVRVPELVVKQRLLDERRVDVLAQRHREEQREKGEQQDS